MTQPVKSSAKSPDTNALSSNDERSRIEGPLTTRDGKITVAQGVVQKIAGIACREISGVHAMGGGASRAFGAIRERIPGSSGPNVAQGVGVEVGETQAAIDLDIVVEYGVSIADLGQSIQRNVKQAVERMTALEVVEVNISGADVHLPSDVRSYGWTDLPGDPHSRNIPQTADLDRHGIASQLEPADRAAWQVRRD
jgi:uncharacterized alkaline shock family protein YloU